MGEFWFEVRTRTDVVGSDGMTQIDTLIPGRRYEATGGNDHWVIISLPGDTPGYVLVSSITVLPDVVAASQPLAPPGDSPPPAAPPPAAPPPAEVPAASVPQAASPPEQPVARSATQSPKTSGLAVASMALGVVWFAWIGSIAAIVLGHISLTRINRSEGRETGRGFAIAGLILGYGALALFVVFVAVNVANRADEQPETVAPLLPDQQLSLSGIVGDVVEYIETTDGRAVLLEGQGSVSITFDTNGGPATGSLTVTMSGTDDENKVYVVGYTGVLDGTFIPETASFEGTLVITGDAPPGFEAAIPTATIWDGGVVVTSDGCARSKAECAFGATRPNVDLYWELDLPVDTIDPAYLARLD